MKLSVVICTRDRASLLKHCLQSILNGRSKPEDIVIVDQSQQTDTAEMIASFRKKFPAIEYYKSPPAGKSHGLNLALEKTRGDFICFTDDDCVVSPDWLEILHQELREPDVACITGSVMPQAEANGRTFLNLVLSDKRKTASQKTDPWRLGCVGCNMTIDKKMFHLVGNFDERLGPGAYFRSALDGDMVYRILKGNKRVVYSPAVKVYHSGWRGNRENDELRYSYAMGLGAFAAKYLKQGDIYPLSIVAIKFVRKLRRLCLGLLLFQKNRIADGYLHVKGMSRGFYRGLFLFHG